MAVVAARSRFHFYEAARGKAIGMGFLRPPRAGPSLFFPLPIGSPVSAAMAPVPFKYIEYRSRCAESVWIRGQAAPPPDPSKAYPESFRELKPGASVRFPDETGFWPFAPENQRIQVTPTPSSAGQTTFLELTGTVSPASRGYVFKDGLPHPNFVGQMGFIDLNLEVSFDDARGDPFCTAPGAYSRARTGHQTSACDGLGAIDGSARLEKQAAGAVCRPYCPDKGAARFTRPLTSNAPPPWFQGSRQLCGGLGRLRRLHDQKPDRGWPPRAGPAQCLCAVPRPDRVRLGPRRPNVETVSLFRRHPGAVPRHGRASAGMEPGPEKL